VSDYTPSWGRDIPDTAPTPEDEQYGDGVEFDHGAAHATDGRKQTGSGLCDGGDEQLPAETPRWVDNTRALRDGDLRDRGAVDATCPDCVTDAARASYQLVEFPHASAFYQLLNRHGCGSAVGDHERVWAADGGLTARAHGQSTDPTTNKYLSYLAVRGPAPAVRAFVEDLLDVATYMKRELRAPALVEHADAAQETGGRVADADRLVGRDRAAAIVSRLPAPGGEDE
jgi:hypothetical protein